MAATRCQCIRNPSQQKMSLVRLTCLLWSSKYLEILQSAVYYSIKCIVWGKFRWLYAEVGLIVRLKVASSNDVIGKLEKNEF